MTERELLGRVRERLGADAAGRLTSLRRRLWSRRGARAAVVAVVAGLAGAVVVQLVARTFPLEAAPLLLLGVALAAFGGWAVYSWRARPSLLAAARRADAELGLRERLGTALELLEGRDTGASDELRDRQLTDARARLGEARLELAFRPKLVRRPAGAAVIGLALVVLLTAWLNAH